MKDFAKLLNTGKTVFSVNDIYQIFSHLNKFSLRNLISRMGKQWLLQNICNGIRALPKYNIYELANVIQKPSYISLETVLYKEGIIFQYYGNTIYSISTKTNDYLLGDKKYVYKTIQPEILWNPKGVVYKDWYAIATPERAMCDRLYLTPHHYFDNLRNIDREKVEEIAEIYDNKRMLLDIKKLKNGTKHWSS